MQPTADPPTPTLTGGDIDIRPGMVLPLPDDAAAAAARDRLSTVDIGVCAPTITALGMLSEGVVFVAAVQGTPYPRPLLSTRVVLLTGSHAGGVVAGPVPDPRNGIPLQHLAINAGAGIVTLEWQPASAAIEFEDATTYEQMEASLRAGWAEAERAADEGIELLVLAAGGAGASTAAAAVVAVITGAEPTMLLTRVVTPAGYYDDNAWMTRCLALRDALHRVRRRDGDPRTVLAALGGADLAAATGLILGAAARRTPVMIDGPVGAAAALLANDFSPQSRSWVVLPDTGRHPAVRLAADSLQLRPWLDLCLDLGEGATSLAALPILQTALTLAGTGEAVEPQPLTRYDSTGNQVFVGVARAVEPAEAGEEEEEAFTGSTVETAPVVYSSANAAGEQAAGAAPAQAATADQAGAPVSAPAAASTSDTAAADGAEPSASDAGRPAKASVTATATADAAKAGSAGDAAKAAGASAKDAAAKDAKAKDPAGKDAAAKDAKAKDPAGKDAAAKDAAAKDAAAKDAAATAPAAKDAATEKDAAAKAGPRPPTRTATKPPAKPSGRTALTGRTAAARTVPPKAPKEPAGKESASATTPGRDAAATPSSAPAAETDAGPGTAKDAAGPAAKAGSATAASPAAKADPATAAKSDAAKNATTAGSTTTAGDAVAALEAAARNATTKAPGANGQPARATTDQPPATRGAGAAPGAPDGAGAADEPTDAVEASGVVGATTAPASPPRPRKRS